MLVLCVQCFLVKYIKAVYLNLPETVWFSRNVINLKLGI